MKLIKFLVLGLLFGIVMIKTEAISWYRIQEMFRFQSFHMYGVISSAIAIGMIGIQWIKRQKIKSIEGEEIIIEDKQRSKYRYLLGGVLFGIGWALTGACPGPIFTLIGAGYEGYVLVLISALLGTLSYGAVKKHLPH